MDIFSQIATKIVREQALIIGPLAWAEAKKVSGLNADESSGEVSIIGSGPDVLNRLVGQYERLFGRASREVCREAATGFMNQIPASQVPASLK